VTKRAEAPDASAATSRRSRAERHPVHGLDDVIHQRARLGVMAVLHEVDRVDFRYLRDSLELTDGNLSRHLRTLEEAGYVEVHKGYEGRRPRTWVKLTRSGARALEAELTALRQLVSRFEESPRRRSKASGESDS
jgi:DNA-binding MarR family transcriptional regulator